MSKTETARALNDSEPQLQIVASVRALRQTVEILQESAATLKQDLQALPAAIARETEKALEPLTRLHPEIAEAVQRYDKLSATQRESLEALAEEMGEKATRTFENRVAILDTTLDGVKNSVDSLKETAVAAIDLPAALTQETGKLSTAANRVRPRWWRRALALILAGAMGAAAIEIGHVGFNRQELRDAQAELAAWQAMWERASDGERASLREIAQRPAQ